jgi:hypothetical protein
MTEEENAILRLLADATRLAREQQDRIGRLIEESQPIDAAVELLCALLDSMHVQRQRLEALRATLAPAAGNVRTT